MITVVIPTDWTSIATAIGTVGAAVAAVGIAIGSDIRTGKRLRDQLEHSDGQLRRQFQHSDHDLMAERIRAVSQIRDEREHARQVREEERQLAREQEQLAEAWAVQIMGARMQTSRNDAADADARPVVVIVNHGRYTITRVQAQFSPGDGSLVGSAQPQHLPDFSVLPHELALDLTGMIGDVYLGVLVPGDAMRILGDVMANRHLRTVYPIVRWTDRWGTWWEHRQGQVRQIEEDAPWITAG